jgi:hypothetical protein
MCKDASLLADTCMLVPAIVYPATGLIIMQFTSGQIAGMCTHHMAEEVMPFRHHHARYQLQGPTCAHFKA